LAQFININLDEKNTILSGHARYYKLMDEGVEEVEVLVPDRLLTPKQEKAVLIRMNKNVAGEWDFDALANKFEMGDLLEWGFDDSFLSSMVDLPEIDDVRLDEEEKKNYLLEIKFSNELDMNDLYDDLISKGFAVRKK